MNIYSKFIFSTIYNRVTSQSATRKKWKIIFGKLGVFLVGNAVPKNIVMLQTDL
jgi:hypothetical protein